MGVRAGRAPEPGRDPRRRARLVAGALALYLAAGLLVTWPAVTHLGSEFAAAGRDGRGGAAPGDHLQAVYNLWLPGDQLANGRAPWLDAYQFQPESPERWNPAGWPLGLVFWPLEALLGQVLAWNLLALLLYVAAGGLTALWLRALGLPVGAALVGGLAFAIAPYRVSQSVEHLLGPLSILLPAALLAFERRRYAWAALALASIPLSGQLHLALGAIPFFAAYALVRRRDRGTLWWTGGAVVAAAAAGLLVRQATIEGSIAEGGRSLRSVSTWSADWLDLLSRTQRGNAEQFAYLGWLTPLAAAAGVVLLWRSGKGALAVLASAAVVVPVVLALGTNTPLYEPLWNALPPFRFPRVPERLLPIACLALAALVAVVVARAQVALSHKVRPAAALPALALALVALDLAVFPYEPTAADTGNRATATLAGLAPGRVLELPVFLPEHDPGSVYQSHAVEAPRERPAGYSTVADRRADLVVRRLQRLNCGDWTGGDALLRSLGVRWLVVHAGLFEGSPFVAPTRAFAEWQLAEHGWRPLVRDGAVTLWGRGAAQIDPPPRSGIVHCRTLEQRRRHGDGRLWAWADGWQLRGRGLPAPRG